MKRVLDPCCGGPADNGHDRDDPPTPYYCSKCNRTKETPTERSCHDCELSEWNGGGCDALALCENHRAIPSPERTEKVNE